MYTDFSINKSPDSDGDLARKAAFQMSYLRMDSPFGFSFKVPEKTPGSLLSEENDSFTYGDATILSGVGLSILAGEASKSI